MIYLVLGSNLGDREWYLEQAKALLAEALKVDMLCSQVLETEAVGFDGPAFLNQAVCFESDIAPEALLDLCQAIETQLGRPRHAAEYDLIIGMDSYNMADLRRLVFPDDRPKLRKLLELTGNGRDVADPWYTGDFAATYADVWSGCAKLLELLSVPEAREAGVEG